MDAEVEGENEIHPSKRPRVAERVAFHVPPEVEPQNLDFDVNEFLRPSPNLVVASVFGDSEIIQRAAVRRGYPVMRPRCLNFGDDIHDLSVRERITDAMQRIPPYCATSLRVRERIDRERAAELAFLEWVVSLCEIQEATGNMFLVESCGRLELEPSLNSKTSERSLLA